MSLGKRKREIDGVQMVAGFQDEERQNNNVPYVSTEVVFDIFLRLPVEFLYGGVRLVCKDWYNLLHDASFIKAHQLQSGACAGIVIQDICSPDRRADFLEVKDGEFSLTTMETMIPAPAISSSLGGLVLLWRPPGGPCSDEFYVKNIVTDQAVKLPTIPPTRRCVGFKSVIAHLPPTGEYKVLCPRQDLDNWNLVQWYVLTIGKGLWRNIGSFDVPGTAQDLNTADVVSAGGVVYWVTNCFKGCPVIAFDLYEETTQMVDVPIGKGDQIVGFARLDERFSFIKVEEENKTGEKPVKVFTLMHIQKNVWANIYKISFDGEAIKMLKDQRFCPWLKNHLQPVAWLDNHQLALFALCNATPSGPGKKFLRTLFIFDFNNGKITRIKEYNGLFIPSICEITKSLASIPEST